jgi:hypothetical protein
MARAGVAMVEMVSIYPGCCLEMRRGQVRCVVAGDVMVGMEDW